MQRHGLQPNEALKTTQPIGLDKQTLEVKYVLASMIDVTLCS